MYINLTQLLAQQNQIWSLQFTDVQYVVNYADVLTPACSIPVFLKRMSKDKFLSRLKHIYIHISYISYAHNSGFQLS